MLGIGTIIFIAIVLIVILIFAIYLIYRSQEKKRKDLQEFSRETGASAVPPVRYERKERISSLKKDMDKNTKKSEVQRLNKETTSPDSEAKNKKKIMKYWKPKFHKESKFFKYTSDGYIAVDADKNTNLKKWR